MFNKILQRVSASPTNPLPQPPAKEFDVADLYRGPATTGAEQTAALPLDEKLRQAYFWVINHAIIRPFYDVEYNDAAQPSTADSVARARRALARLFGESARIDVERSAGEVLHAKPIEFSSDVPPEGW